MNLRTKPVPGKCRVRWCRKPPRDLGTHPKSHQLCGHHHKALWRQKNPEKAAYDNLRASARKRHKAFSITFEDFMAVIGPTRYVDDKGRTRYSLHVDRINTELGYIRGNLRVCTCEENVRKENEERRQRFVDAKISNYTVEDDDADTEPF